MFKFLAITLIGIFIASPNLSIAKGAKDNTYSPDLTRIAKETEIHVFPVTRMGITNDEAQLINETLVTQLKKIGYPTSYHTPNENSDYYNFNIIEDDSALSKPLDWYKNFILTFNKPGIYVMPKVVIREAKLEEQTARWDGARQSLRLNGGGDMGSWTGSINVFSIRLEVFDNKAHWLMTTYGGISVPVEADYKSRQMLRKEHLFANKKDHKALIRGIERAIWPFKKQFNI